MFPIGARVVVRSVENQLGLFRHRPLGREAVVTDHVDGMFEVALLHFGAFAPGFVRYVFDAEHLELVSTSGAVR